VVESVKAASDVYSPVSGSVAARNDALSDKPSSSTRTRMGGWLMRVTRGSAPADGPFLKAAEYAQFVKEAG